jgi:hypothetical protein
MLRGTGFFVVGSLSRVLSKPHTPGLPQTHGDSRHVARRESSIDYGEAAHVHWRTWKNHRRIYSVAMVVAVALMAVAPPWVGQAWVIAMAPVVAWVLWREWHR